MSDLPENEAFYYGLICGIKLFQQKIVVSHKRGEHILINNTPYYFQDGRERLQEMLNKIFESEENKL
ncbi:hypothetical protein [Parablautia muri]|uniref:Uncharacterized protein n=1 Tax=Parablautia muri TaxID=2320879 RepID=A0A9X5BKF5_9FIRM|nr:hypothetical protein [Parablautia muri]NBJ95701.1 hypothetical protein [Parablautia muri]